MEMTIIGAAGFQTITIFMQIQQRTVIFCVHTTLNEHLLCLLQNVLIVITRVPCGHKTTRMACVG